MRREFFSSRAGDTGFLSRELRQDDIREERTLRSVLQNGAFYKTCGLGALYTYYVLQKYRAIVLYTAMYKY